MMPYSRTFAIATNGPQEPISLDFQPVSTITAAMTTAGAEAFLVQVTLDDVFDQNGPKYVAPASARWFTLAGAPTAASGYVTVDGPWRAIRLNVTAPLVAAATFQVAQAAEVRR